MHNPHNLPEYLINMTQARWDSLTPSQRDKLRDTSKLHPKLIGLEGKTVEVSPKRAFGRSKFRVGVSTGWRPIHLALRAGSHGSSDVVTADEDFTVVSVR